MGLVLVLAIGLQTWSQVEVKVAVTSQSADA